MLKFTNIKHKKITIVSIAIVLLIIVGIVVFLVTRATNTKKQPTFNAAKIYSVMKSDDCKQAMPILEATKPNSSQAKASAAMLSYRERCYIRIGQLSKALNDAELRKKIDIESNNKQDLSSVDAYIDLIKNLVSLKSKPLTTIPTDKVSPAFEKELEEQDRQAQQWQ